MTRGNRKYKGNTFCRLYPACYLFLLVFGFGTKVQAQCPANIGFETGNFAGWKLYTGSVSSVNTQNVISLTEVPGPVTDRHEMLSSLPGDGVDEYGGFPKNCPNGSQHSIRLGNDRAGNEAEGVSYEFTIPPNAENFSIIYYYAIVIEDPGHPEYQQPRLQIDVLNVTDNEAIDCSSFDFVVDGETPGFHLSPIQVNGIPVWYKDWSANTINLGTYAGKTIRIFFKTADCTFLSHFGYAYLDVSTECSSSFIGAAFCPADTAISVTAPFGYQHYTWFNENYTQTLGTGQTLHLEPPPPSGTKVKVKLEPFSGYGCVDTLTASLIDTLTITANAGPDVATCNNIPVQIGVLPVPGLVYHWDPPTGLSDPSVSNPTALVNNTTRYVLTVRTLGGGCATADTVYVNSDFLDTHVQVNGPVSHCSADAQTVLKTDPSAQSIQWYKNGIPIAGATQVSYIVQEEGDYYAVLTSSRGCTINTDTNTIHVFPSPVAIAQLTSTPVQCFLGNSFSFLNQSTILSGNMEYDWVMGDGTVLHTKDISYSYSQPGTYNVELKVRAAGNCISTWPVTVKVLPSAIADFAVNAVCINLDLSVINNTHYSGSSQVHYLWDFGNSDVSGAANPVYQYHTPGDYTVTLTTSTDECPQPSVKQLPLRVDVPEQGTNYPVKTAIFNYPLQLEARRIGNQVLWSPAVNLNNVNSYTPVYKGVTEQLYKIKLTTASGCVTIDSQLVKTIKKIEIHVPAAFTPNGDGQNDFLKPLLYGFSKVNHFRVYNRWGKIVFQMESDQPGWDGKIKDIPQEMQTYIWVIEAVDVDGVVHHAKGTTILIR